MKKDSQHFQAMNNDLITFEGDVRHYDFMSKNTKSAQKMYFMKMLKKAKIRVKKQKNAIESSYGKVS